MAAEKCAYALARYSRSSESIRESIEWVRSHDSASFLENFYFQYGHASIADLGHVVLCFEGLSELAAIEIEDEQLWDGQARSSRYQDFARFGIVIPPGFSQTDIKRYRRATSRLLSAYREIHDHLSEWFRDTLPLPADMSSEARERSISARAFDVARYALFLGIPTGVGQVTSIRTLEKQVRRLRVSPYSEVREIAGEISEACSAPPTCSWGTVENGPIAPTLARHLDANHHLMRARQDLEQWACENLPQALLTAGNSNSVDLLKPTDPHAEITATLLYPVTNHPFRDLYELVCDWNAARRNEVIDLALRSRGRKDDILRHFRGGCFAFDIVMDIGAYRDLHRHRRCEQFRQGYGTSLGYETPAILGDVGLKQSFELLLQNTFRELSDVSEPSSHYLLPFAARVRVLFKMDFAEAEYIVRLRSGVKGHFSYRQIAWEMKRKMEELEPHLGRLMQATPLDAKDFFKR